MSLFYCFISFYFSVRGKTVAEILTEKHPKGQPINTPCLVSHEKAETLPFHSSIFNKIDDNAFERAAQNTKRSHGPSGLDSCQWRKLLTSFEKASINLRKTMAILAYRIATEVVPSTSLEAYNNSRLIPLDKCPGFRPIGIGEVLRRIIGRCISSCLGAEVQRIGGNIQQCFGQTAGIEHKIHALRRIRKGELWSCFTDRCH